MRGIGSFVLTEKLKALKTRLKIWNKTSFGNLEVKKKEALKKVKDWDVLEERNPFTLREREQKVEVVNDFKRWALLEEVHWRQKSREIWLKEGDRNTWFFHRLANSHKRGNYIIKMKINENWVTEDANLKLGIVGAFKSLLTDTGKWRANIDGLTFQSINEDEASKMENPFTVEEVFTALSNLNGDKAPGPDGFTMAFWQFSWDIVKEDIMRLFKDFHDSSEFVRNLNATFLVLVLKRKVGGGGGGGGGVGGGGGGVEDFKDFRPISLVGSLYNLLAKVLANKLKKVMHKLINKAQNAFVEGR